MPAKRTYESPLRETQALQTHEQILDALLKMLETISADEIAIRELADAAGVSLRTVYRHFPDRDANAVAAFLPLAGPAGGGLRMIRSRKFIGRAASVSREGEARSWDPVRPQAGGTVRLEIDEPDYADSPQAAEVNRRRDPPASHGGIRPSRGARRSPHGPPRPVDSRGSGCRRQGPGQRRRE